MSTIAAREGSIYHGCDGLNRSGSSNHTDTLTGSSWVCYKVMTCLYGIYNIKWFNKLACQFERNTPRLIAKCLLVSPKKGGFALGIDQEIRHHLKSDILQRAKQCSFGVTARWNSTHSIRRIKTLSTSRMIQTSLA